MIIGSLYPRMTQVKDDEVRLSPAYQKDAKSFGSTLADIVQDLWDRVAYFEERVDEGTLLELPCKIGQTCCIYTLEEGHRISYRQGTVQSITFSKEGTKIKTTLLDFVLGKKDIGRIYEKWIDLEAIYFPQDDKELEEFKAKCQRVEIVS